MGVYTIRTVPFGVGGILKREGEECSKCADDEYGTARLARGQSATEERVVTDIGGTRSDGTTTT